MASWFMMSTASVLQLLVNKNQSKCEKITHITVYKELLWYTIAIIIED